MWVALLALPAREKKRAQKRLLCIRGWRHLHPVSDRQAFAGCDALGNEGPFAAAEQSSTTQKKLFNGHPQAKNAAETYVLSLRIAYHASLACAITWDAAGPGVPGLCVHAVGQHGQQGVPSEGGDTTAAERRRRRSAEGHRQLWGGGTYGATVGEVSACAHELFNASFFHLHKHATPNKTVSWFSRACRKGTHCAHRWMCRLVQDNPSTWMSRGIYSVSRAHPERAIDAIQAPCALLPPTL